MEPCCHLVGPNTLHNFNDFLVNFEYYLQVCVHCLDGSEKLEGGTVFFENLHQQIVIRGIISFDKVNKRKK